MKRQLAIIISLFLFLVASTGISFFVFFNTPKPPEKLKPIIMVLPHQDDEMFLAGTAHQYLRQGREVYSLMITDGAKSHIKQVLSYKGYKLSPQEFSAARNREYAQSMLVLGLKPDHIFFANEGGERATPYPTYQDGKMTAALAEQAIRNFYQQIGDGIYLTVASHPGEAKHLNPDHRAIQDGLKNISEISEKFYFSDEATEHSHTVELTPDDLLAKQKALAEYQVWAPNQGRYAIGYQSVKSLLDSWQNNSQEHVLGDL